MIALTVLALPARAQTIVGPASALKKLSLEELMDLEVTSVSRAPEKLLNAASAIQVITSDDIRRSGASNIPEALRLATNLQVAQKGSHAWGISARGFNTELANKLLVMIDGRTVYTPLFSGVFWDHQDYLLEDLDRIEVISGPGGTLWGANAVNGVINISSKSARDTQGFIAEAGVGSVLRSYAAARFGTTLAPNVFLRVYGKYSDHGDELLDDGSDAADAWHMGQGGFRLDVESSASDRVTLQGDIYRAREGMVTGGQSHADGGNLLARWARTLSDDSALSLQIYFDRTRLTQPTPPFVINTLVLSDAGILRDDLDTYDLDFQHRFRWDGMGRVVWGLGARLTQDHARNSPALGFFPEDLRQEVYSAFAQDEFEWRDGLTLTLGAKLEHNGYTGWETEPNVRLQWAVTARDVLWTAISRAIRAPSRIDRDLAEPIPPGLVVLTGGSDFASERLIAYEAGYRSQMNSRTAVSVSVFYNDYDHVRSTSFTPGTILPLFFANNLEGKTYGLEVNGDYRVSETWRLRAGYTLLREHLRIKPGQSDINNARNETADPRNQVSLRSSWDLPGNWELDGGLRWVDPLEINNGGAPAQVPGYCELDVRVGWKATEAMELSVVGQNLLHDHHLEYGPPGATRGAITRTVYGKVAWRF